MVRSSRSEVFCKKGVLKTLAKFTGKHLCQSLYFSNCIKKEILAQVFSCKFCEISKNMFFYRTPPVAASEWYYDLMTSFYVCFFSLRNMWFNVYIFGFVFFSLGEGVFHSFFRSSRLKMFFKMGAPKHFANFIGKHLCWSLFLFFQFCNIH